MRSNRSKLIRNFLLVALVIGTIAATSGLLAPGGVGRTYGGTKLCYSCR